MQQRLRKEQWLDTFDGADPNGSTATRSPGETSIQALAMLNSNFVEEQSDLLAVRAGMAYNTDTERINYAYRLGFGRAPAAKEIRDCAKYLEQAPVADKKSGLPDDPQPRAALASPMHMLPATAAFVF